VAALPPPVYLEMGTVQPQSAAAIGAGMRVVKIVAI